MNENEMRSRVASETGLLPQRLSELHRLQIIFIAYICTYVCIDKRSEQNRSTTIIEMTTLLYGHLTDTTKKYLYIYHIVNNNFTIRLSDGQTDATADPQMIE